MHATTAVYHPSSHKHPSKLRADIADIFTRLGLPSGNRIDRIAEIRQGFSVSVIDKLVYELAIPQQTLLQTIALSSATLELFEGDRDAARDWLSEPAKALGGYSPLQHLDTEAGADEVQDLIGRLEHGVIT